MAILFLMWPATGGMALLGSTRLWGIAPGLLLSLLGSLLVFARPLFFRDTPRWFFPPGFWVFAVLTAFIVLRAPFDAVPYAARWEALRWVCLLAAAFSWTQLGGHGYRWKWLLAILLMALALNCLYALLQHIDGSSRVLWTQRPEQYGLRVSGTYLCPNHLANMLAMGIPLAGALLFLPEAGFPLRLMSLYFLVLAAPVLYWTHSRSGWLGALGGVAATVLMLAARKGRQWFWMALLLLPLSIAGAGILAWKALPAVRERIQAVWQDPDQASGSRLQMWQDVPAMIRARPLWGFGGGSFVWTYPRYQKAVKHHLTYDYLHNEYLQVLVEYGAIGLALLALGLLWGGWGWLRAFGNTRDPAASFLLAGAAGSLTSALLHALFDFNFHIFPNPHALVWIGGVAWSVWAGYDGDIHLLSRRYLRWRRGAAVLLSVGCLGAIVRTVTGGLSYWDTLKGELARQQLAWDEAIHRYQRAIGRDAGNPYAYLGRGLALLTRARWHRDPDLVAEIREKGRLADAAATDFLRVQQLNPYEMTALWGMAQAHNLRHDPEGALEWLHRTVAHQPRHIFYREQLGIQLRRMGRVEDALEVFRQNLAVGLAGEITQQNIRALEERLARTAASLPSGETAPAGADPQE